MRIFNTPYRLALFTVLPPLFVCLALWSAVVRMPVQLDLEERGVRTTAVVEAVSAKFRTTWATPGGRSVRISYRFTTRAGDVIQDRMRRSYNYNAPVTAGRQFSLTYLPEAPHKHFSSLQPRYASWFTTYAFLGLAVVFVALAIYEYWRRPAGWTGPRLWPPVTFW
ncbi:MAG: hypothetical protein AAGB10_09215 [Pseudomonadota bacterium]